MIIDKTTERLCPPMPNAHAELFSELFCAACAELVQMLTLEDAARIAGVSVDTLRQWIENRSLHYMKPTVETVLICRDSLYQKTRRTR